MKIKNKMISRKIFTFIIFIMLISNIYSVCGYKIAVNENDFINNEISLSGREYNSRTFYSNYSKRFYIIYSHFLVGDIDANIAYSSSIDGNHWTNTNTLLYYDVIGRTLDIYIHSDGQFIDYCFEYLTDDLYWGRFEILLNGSIINNVTSTKIIDGQFGSGSWEIDDEYSIVADKENYVYISFEAYNGVSRTHWIVKSKYNNGTWNLEEFEHKWNTESEWSDNGHGNPPNDGWGGELFLMKGKEDVGIVFWYLSSGEKHYSMYYDNSTNDWIDITGGLINNSVENDWAYDAWTVGYANNIAVFFKQQETNPDGVIGLEAQFLDMDNYAWENQTQISFDVVGDAGSIEFTPLVSVSEKTNNINFVWSIVGNDTIWYRRMYYNGTLENYDVLESDLDNNILENQISSHPTGLSPMSIAWLVNEGSVPEYEYSGDFILHNYLTFLDDDWEIPFMLYNTSLSTLYNEWMFRGERYKLEAYVLNASVFYINFTDGLHDIFFHWNNESKTMSINNTQERDFLIGLYSYDYEEYDSGMVYLKWEFILDVNIMDSLDIEFDYYIYNDEYDSSITGDTELTANIYSDGEIVSYTFDGDSGRTVGGDSLEIYHTNSTGNGGLVEVIYRRLQHAHLEFMMDVEDNDCFDVDENSGVIQMGIKYLDDSGWVNGWYLELSMVNGAIDAGGGGAGKAWIIPYITWYAMDTTGTTQAIKNDVLSGYPESGDNINSDITYSQFIVDLWFNTMNYSTTIGGRINTKYYGMEEGGWLLWTDWNPVRTNITESMFFYDLFDTTGNVTKPIDIELMKFWIRVLKSGNGAGSCDTHTWSIKNPELSITLASDRMEALNTPEGIDTLVVNMPSGGFLQPITKAIQGIGKSISSGMFGVIKMIMGAMDTLLVDVLHSPVSMSQMINWIMIQGSYVTEWFTVVLQYASDMLNVFSRMITFITSITAYFVNMIIWVLVYVVPFPLHVIRFIVAIIGGNTYTIGGFTWDLTTGSELIQASITIGAVFIGYSFVIWVLWGNMHGEGEPDLERLPKRLLMIPQYTRETYQSVSWIYSRMRNEIISLYNFIRSHIPQIGGSGGETSE